MAKKTKQFRHENGFGSIIKLSGNRRKPFAVRITTGWKDGKQVRKYLGYYKSEAEALLALAEYHKDGFDIDMSKFTLKQVFEEWFKTQEKRNLSKSVLATHKMAYSRLGTLGNVPIKNIKAATLQKWFEGIDLKPASKGKVKSTLTMVYDYATQNDIVTKNYAKFIKNDEKIEKTGKVYTDDEIKLLWEHKDQENARILLILLYTGLRVGELINISKDDINFDKCYMVGGLKTEAGRDRIIPIHSKILPLVREQLGNNKWMIQASHGGQRHYNVLLNQNIKFMSKLGLDHKFHDTRKTAISLMHSADIPIETIKIIVGHVGDNVTEKIYLYKNPEELVKVINKLKIEY